MQVPISIQDEIINHCRRLYPNQACGLVLFDETGVAREVYPTVNMGAWPYGFQISPTSQYLAFRHAREKGLIIQGVYHAHLLSRAIPTERDLERPIPEGYLYLIVSLLNPEIPDIRGYLLNAGNSTAVELETGALSLK